MEAYHEAASKLLKLSDRGKLVNYSDLHPELSEEDFPAL
jgi:hypothetical protein